MTQSIILSLRSVSKRYNLVWLTHLKEEREGRKEGKEGGKEEQRGGMEKERQREREGGDGRLGIGDKRKEKLKNAYLKHYRTCKSVLMLTVFGVVVLMTHKAT